MKETITMQLAALAEQLGIAVGVLWGAMIRQAPGWALYHALWVVALIVFIVYVWRVTRELINYTKPGYDEEVPRLFGWAIRTLALFLGGVGIMVNTYWCVSSLVNPEYVALAWLLEKTTGR